MYHPNRIQLLLSPSGLKSLPVKLYAALSPAFPVDLAASSIIKSSMQNNFFEPYPCPTQPNVLF
jgi:hypothetical protein